MPSSEYRRPAGGAGAALLVGGLLLNWLLRSRHASRRAMDTPIGSMSGPDWKGLRRAARRMNGERVEDFRSGWSRLEMPAKGEALQQVGKWSRRAAGRMPDADFDMDVSAMPWRVVGGALAVGALGYLLGRAFGGGQGHDHAHHEHYRPAAGQVGTTGTPAAAGYPLA